MEIRGKGQVVCLELDILEYPVHFLSHTDKGFLKNTILQLNLQYVSGKVQYIYFNIMFYHFRRRLFLYSQKYGAQNICVWLVILVVKGTIKVKGLFMIWQTLGITSNKNFGR